MKTYITTPIYYVNDNPHIGHAYTTITADVLIRYFRLFGYETYFLTGIDEHGQKVQQAAQKIGMPEQDYVEKLAVSWKENFKQLDISNDIFMRTTNSWHKQHVQECLQKLYDKGEIYSAEYTGWYCVSEEVFYPEKDLVNGLTPTGKEVVQVTEKNYFFKMSKYQEKLIQHIEEHPDFIQPAGKRSEILGFLKQPLEDLCISRPKSRLAWGIEIPFDKDFVTYVWFDALLNYRSAILHEKGDQAEDFWKNCIHLIGKDILTTHAVYWTTMLMGLGIQLPKTIMAHGWWLSATGGKISKSDGTSIAPMDIAEIAGVDELRYFLSRDLYLGNDARFSNEAVSNRLNSELANKLGNLFSRTSKLLENNFGGITPSTELTLDESKELTEFAKKIPTLVKERVENLEPNLAIGHVIDLLDFVNKYIDNQAPWKLVKTDLKLAAEVLVVSLSCLQLSAVLLEPVMPTKMNKLLTCLGGSAKLLEFKVLEAGLTVKTENLFPRITF